MVRFTLDPNNAAKRSGEELARLDAMTEAEINAALADPENPPLNDDELRKMEAVRRAREMGSAASST